MEDLLKMKKRKIRRLIFLFIFCAGFFSSLTACSKTVTAPLQITAFKLNTVVSVTLYDSNKQELLDTCMNMCDTYEKIFSRTNSSSELYAMNHRQLLASDQSIQLSPTLAYVIEKGLYYSKLSNDAFDITLAPVSTLWDFSSANPLVPDEADIFQALKSVGTNNLSLQGDTITFSNPNTMIDLGAIAKGYIADQLKLYLLSEGVKSAIINLGGNVLCIGAHPDGTPFQIGIQQPFGAPNETNLALSVSDYSIVSSGIYERYFVENGVLYHHVLDSHSGYPINNNLLQVTILSKNSLEGDALSTTCLALGLEKGMDLINSYDDVYAIFITDTYEYIYSDGFPPIYSSIN